MVAIQGPAAGAVSYRAAIIGCGMIAGSFEDFAAPGVYSHAKAYRADGAFPELAFVDSHPERAAALAAKAGGRAFDDLGRLLDVFRPHAVSVSSRCR